MWMSYNQPKKLPTYIGEMSCFVKLNLDNNQLTSPPPAIGCLSALRQVRSQLHSLPAAVSKLKSLVDVTLMANPIPALPLEMAALQNIKNLNLYSEMMESPPTEVAAKGWSQTQAYLNQVAYSSKTGILHLDEMALRRSPSPVCLMTELTELSMHDNNIKVVPEDYGSPRGFCIDCSS
jgi:Leucine-rich repeat (LRR) protein